MGVLPGFQGQAVLNLEQFGHATCSILNRIKNGKCSAAGSEPNSSMSCDSGRMAARGLQLTFAAASWM